MKRLELWYPVRPLLITQKFGENAIPLYKELGLKGHPGVDLMASHGQIVRAAHDGIIVNAGIPDNSEGYGVVLRTLEPVDFNGESYYVKSIYWHLIREIPVHPGQVVKAGDIIGYADNTGASQGDHLHFSVKKQVQGEEDWQWYNVNQQNGFNGAEDPTPYWNGYYAEDATFVLGTLNKIIELCKKVIGLLSTKVK